MGLKKYFIRRLITTFITLLIVVSLLYFLFRLPAYVTGRSPEEVYGWRRLQQSSKWTPEEKEELFRELRKSMGLPPKDAGFAERMGYFFQYMKNMLTFNFGYNANPDDLHPIAPALARRLPYTLLLLGPSTFFTILIGIWLGVRAGKEPGSTQDKAFTVGGLSIYSLPSYWLGPFLLWFFAMVVPIFPPQAGPTLPNLFATDPFYKILGMVAMLTLPVFTLVTVSVGGWIYLMRNSLTDVITEDYIFTARAKGLDERAVVYKHAFRNALFPIWTSIVLSVATMWTGAIITEQIFSLPGVGSMLIEAVLQPMDYPIAQTIFYFIALTTLGANLIADISYALLDPRVQYD
ncbi:MAG: ABC transporter permease [Candidatus Korarchaeota archaeon]|nr:ABC transporter permease [Candidatus Korarchaeota archaeon]NIU83836.1 ABC transporter permease subunit [Candidatus Thorarchaeota archaeon]NIW15250.1 ABC transporter permease subunit [Candidatus Thorarchaeota archaeon]NIW53227.1 ABC transporter permease subunit [Candidatus Korarchaeota archaeon]